MGGDEGHEGEEGCCGAGEGHEGEEGGCSAGHEGHEGKKGGCGEGHEGEEGGRRSASNEGYEGKEGGCGASSESHEGEESGCSTGKGHEGVRRSTVCQWQFQCTCLPAHLLSVTGRRGSLGAAGPNRPLSVEGVVGVRRRLGRHSE